MSLLSSIFGSSEVAAAAGAKKKNSNSSQHDGGADIFAAPPVAVPAPKVYPPAKKMAAGVSKKRKRMDDAVHVLNKGGESTVEDAADTADVPIHHQDDANHDRTVFVGNLPLATTRKELTRLFHACGAIESTRIRNVATQGIKLPPEQAGNQDLVKKVAANLRKFDETSKINASGYVVFKNATAVQAALNLNNTMIKDEHGLEHMLRVDTATPTTMDPKRTVFVGNLPYGTDEDSLRAHFTQGLHGGGNDNNDPVVHGVRVVRDRNTHRCKGFAYVLLHDATLAATALRTLDGSHYMGRTLRVQVCGRRTKKEQQHQGGSNARSSALFQPAKRAKKDKKSGNEFATTPVGVLRRVLEREASTKKRRARGSGSSTTADAATSKNKKSVSRRTLSQSKAGKKVKKLERRATKGMGKAKASKKA